MELINEIVNELVIHYTYRLKGSEKVFVYDNGNSKITTLKEYKKGIA